MTSRIRRRCSAAHSNSIRRHLINTSSGFLEIVEGFGANNRAHYLLLRCANRRVDEGTSGMLPRADQSRSSQLLEAAPPPSSHVQTSFFNCLFFSFATFHFYFLNSVRWRDWAKSIWRAILHVLLRRVLRPRGRRLRTVPPRGPLGRRGMLISIPLKTRHPVRRRGPRDLRRRRLDRHRVRRRLERFQTIWNV